jgi:hypothetical protein
MASSVILPGSNLILHHVFNVPSAQLQQEIISSTAPVLPPQSCRRMRGGRILSARIRVPFFNVIVC